MERLDRFVPTLDDWYPNFERHLVRVSFLPLYGGDWRVCVWGNDDCGMERDFTSKTDAQHCFSSIVSEPYLTKQALLIKGFDYA